MRSIVRISIVFVIAFFLFLAIFMKIKTNNKEKKRSAFPERIICLDCSIAETICMLGAVDKIVGITSYCKWPKELLGKTRVGHGFGDLNLETIISLNPDLIFCWRGKDERILSKMGCSLFIIHPNKIKDITKTITRIGKIIGKEDDAKKIILDMEKRIESIKKKLKLIKKRPLVYFEDRRTHSTRASGSLTHDMITFAGGINIAQGQIIPYPVLNNEFIIKANPDVIVIEEEGIAINRIKKRPGWEKISAVKSNRIYKQNSYYTHYSPRCIEGVEQYAKWFHPGIF